MRTTNIAPRTRRTTRRPSSGRALARAAAVTLALAPALRAHFDPPGERAVTTTIDVKELEIHDPAQTNALGRETGTLNDGLQGVGGWAEILVLVEVKWGGDHGSSYWAWQGEYHFVHTGNDVWHVISEGSHQGSSDYDLGSVFRTANPDSLPVQTNIAEHSECTPREEPEFEVQVFEVDKGSTWTGDLLAAVSGAAAGGTGGAVVASVVKAGLSGLNPNDAIEVHVGSAPEDEPEGPYAVIEFRESSATFDVATGCGGDDETALLVPSGALPPAPATGTIDRPATLRVALSDEGFLDRRRPALIAAARAHEDPGLARRNRRIARWGIDGAHPFGRNAAYARQRFDALRDVLDGIDAIAPAESEQDPEAVAERRRLARETVVGTAWLVAAQAWAEAVVREASPEALEAAQAELSGALELAAAGRPGDAVDAYARATALLLEALHPLFNESGGGLPVEPRLLTSSVRGADGEGGSGMPSLSAGGRVLAFASEAADLVPGDANAARDVFVRRLDGTRIVRASVGPGGLEANGPSGAPSLDGDGRRVAFTSRASNLVAGDANEASDVFVHDTLTRETVCASRGPDGAPASGASSSAAMSRNGRFVAFASDAPDLVPGDANGARDVFVHDLLTGETVRASTGPGGGADGRSSDPAISADGRFVAFASLAENLVPGDRNDAPDIFVTDLETGDIERVSEAAGGGDAHGFFAQSPAISDDGRWVAFVSDAPDLVEDDRVEMLQVFLHDRGTGTTRLVSRGRDGAPGDGDHLGPRISGDGRWVVYDSDSRNLSDRDADAWRDVFLYDAAEGTTTLSSRSSGEGPADGDSGIWDGGLAIAGSGQAIAFESRAGNLGRGAPRGSVALWVHDRATGALRRADRRGRVAPAGGSSRHPSVAADGRRTAFGSEASDLVPGDRNGVEDVFVHDRSSDRIRRASVTPEGRGADGASRHPSLALDGRWVAFASAAEDLVAGDANGYEDVFARDLARGETVLVSAGRDGAAADGPSRDPSIAARGRWVAFTSSATNLAGEDANGYDDVFVRDLRTGQTVIASLSDDGRPAEGASGEAFRQGDARRIAANGQRVVFSSLASNLVPGDGNDARDVFVRDLVEGRTILVSARPDGRSGDEESSRATISPDGRRVLFTSEATDLVPGDDNGSRDVFLRDLETGELRLVSVASDGAAANGGSGYGGVSLSPDARTVAFTSLATNLVPGDTNDSEDVFVRFLPTGETLRAGVDPRGEEARYGTTSPSVAAAGRAVAYRASFRRLAGPDGRVARDVVARRLPFPPAGTVNEPEPQPEPEPEPDPELADFVRADVNGDGRAAEMADAVRLLGWSFLGENEPGCLAACDADGDGSVAAVTDAVWILSYGFLGGRPPPGPFPACGSATPDDRTLGCARSFCD